MFFIIGAFGVYQFWWYTCVGYYQRRNHHVSIGTFMRLIVEKSIP